VPIAVGVEGVDVPPDSPHPRPPGEFQAQAAIAARHADARTAAENDWVQIVEWYDDLVRLSDSLVARLNQAGLQQDVHQNILATFDEFEVGLLRTRTREGMAVGKSKGKLRGKQPSSAQSTRPNCAGCTDRRVQHQRSRRTVLHLQGHRLPDLQRNGGGR
jgi:hypothetical protein